MTSANEQDFRVAVVVLGMHRSGTSATAGLLSHLGCDLPKELMPPSGANSKGYFESVKAYRLNDALLASGGSSWDDPTAFDSAWYASPQQPEFMHRAAGVLQQEFGDSRLFVLKDPRICRLLPFWRDVLESQGAVPRFVCIHRHPREVAASLSRREGWPETMGVLLWLRHVLDAEFGSRGTSRVFVSYDMLMADWRAVVTKIGEALDITWPLPIDRAAAAADEFLSGDLRHFRAESEAPARPSDPVEWVATAYDILDRWAKDGERTEDHARLDVLRAELEAASPMLGKLFTESRQLGATTAKVEAELTASKTRVGDLEESLSELQRGFLQRGYQVEELRNLNEVTTAAIERLQAELNAAGKELEIAAETSRSEREAERRRLDLSVAEFEAFKQAVISSTSWRLTAPLRSVSRVLRK